MGKNIYDFTREELQHWFGERDYPAYRADQVYEWLYKGATSFDDMTNLPKALREELKQGGEEALVFAPFRILTKQESKDGTVKYLFGLSDGHAIESVFMTYDYGNTLCVSSQVGCRMGCTFCASTKAGLVRNLTAGEMMQQVLAAERDRQAPVGHIVVMGMGEPFDNYDELARFLTLLHEPKGKNMSRRNITVSTCGIVPMIRRFGDEFPQVNLAISLHAPTDELRRETMPVANRYPLAELMKACQDHAVKTGRRITYEYALIAGHNDDEKTLGQLVDLLRGTLCHVNLIPLNEVAENPMKATDRATAQKIAAFLTEQGVPATVRRSLGRDIDAACGQLRLKEGTFLPGTDEI